MAEQITNYQCPNCTGPLHYGSGSGQLECDFCSSKFEVSVIEQLYADKAQEAASAGAAPQWDTSTAGAAWSAEEAAHLRAYGCPSCGAELICDDTTAASSCPYCGNPTVVPGQLAGQLKPDCLIPFKLDKNAAVEALKSFYKGKKFLPKAFASANHIEEIKGVYVPFWLFDCQSFAAMRFHGEIVKTYRRGNYEITETDHYRVTREGNITFEKIPVDGSSKMPNAHMDAIEPFNYGELRQFSPGYLPGFLADKYDEDAEMCSKRANERIVASTESAFTATATGYTSLRREYSDIKLRSGDVKYALMPVWLLSTKWKDKSFLFAINGQTGKPVGDLPVARGKFWGWFAGIAVPIAAILALILYNI